MKRKGLFPVGRLDRDTEGLLLITDDGDFAHSITSPKKHVDKKYVAKLDGEITEDTVKAFSDGIEFSDGTKCRSAVLECDENDKKTGIVTICEGKYHQVKKMFLCCGLKVSRCQHGKQRKVLGSIVLKHFKAYRQGFFLPCHSRRKLV